MFSEITTLSAYQRTTDEPTLQGYVEFLQRMMMDFNISEGNNPQAVILEEQRFAEFCHAILDEAHDWRTA